MWELQESPFSKQAHFGRVKGRYWTCHGPTIKALFESSTFINLKQSIDLKAESSKLPERIIKQPVSSSVHFSAICTRHFTVSGGRPISLQSPPALILSSFSFSWLSCLCSHKGEAVTGESPWGHGSPLHSGSPRERMREFQASRTTVRSSAASSRRALGHRGHSWVASLLRSGYPCEGCEGELKIAMRKFQTSLPYTPRHPIPQHTAFLVG